MFVFVCMFKIVDSQTYCLKTFKDRSKALFLNVEAMLDPLEMKFSKFIKETVEFQDKTTQTYFSVSSDNPIDG